MSEFVGIADLEERWGYTRQGVHKLAARTDFPAPFAVVNQGRTRVWRLADIRAYERDRPELGDEAAKLQKQVGFYLATLRGRDGGRA